MIKKKLFFDHIYKTGGMSINDALRRTFPKFHVFNKNPEKHSIAISSNISDYIGGHFEFDFGEKLSQEHYYTTVLRDPVERFLSLFYFLKEQGRIHLAKENFTHEIFQNYEVLFSLSYKLDEFIKSDYFKSSGLINFQAKHFAKRLIKNFNDVEDKILYEAAKSSLEDYSLVGSFEDLKQFVDDVSSNFHFIPAELAHINITSENLEREKTSRKTINYLRKINNVDFMLIKWAKENFRWKKTKKISIAKSIRSEHLNKILPIDKFEHTNKSIYISDVICSGNESNQSFINPSEDIIIKISCQSNLKMNNLAVGIAIYDKNETLAYGINSSYMGYNFDWNENEGFSVIFRLKNSLAPGPYYLTAAIHKNYDANEIFDWIDKAAFFFVKPELKFFLGYSNCAANIKVVKL